MTWKKRRWVAKKVVTLGPSRPDPSSIDLEEETLNALILLKRLDSFFQRFVEYARGRRQSNLLSGK
jgi:hypothetical protein